MTALELKEHPARTLNRITGKMEPLITDSHSVWLDGRMIGYCGAVPHRPITLTEWFSESECDAILQFVAQQGLAPTRVCCPPQPEASPRRPMIWTPEYEDDE